VSSQARSQKKPRTLSRTDHDGVGRFYRTPVGELPSVTTVLSHTKSEGDRSGLESWRARVGEEEARRVSKEATERGTRVHEAAEAYLLGRQHDQILLSSDERALFGALEPTLLRVRGSAVLRTELAVWHQFGFAGTLDLVAGDSCGELVLYDWKTSRRSKRREWIGDYFCQAGAYSLAFEFLNGAPVTRAEVVIATLRGPDIHRLNYDELRAWQRRFLARRRAFAALRLETLPAP